MPYVVLLDHPGQAGLVVLQDVSDDGVPGPSREVAADDLPAAVAERERADAPRWVLDDTARRYPPLLAAGARLERCHDLRLCHAILRRSLLSRDSWLARAPVGPWDRPTDTDADDAEPDLFDTLDESVAEPLDAVPELRRQLDAVAGSAEPGRLRLLLAAESAGALVAAEMHHDGLPWSAAEHDRLLTETFGPRPPVGMRPARLEELAARIRDALDRPGLNPDSQPDLLAALRSAGCAVESTRRSEIAALDHAVVAPLLEYKSLSRLLSANGWTWLDTWVRDGRFRPDYVVGGVVTGRWATSGGGALQLPAAIRGAARADDGWKLVVADAAQLEPRVLAAMSGDTAMAAAGRHADLYEGLVDAGVVATRHDAKYAMLGAIYGATSGSGGALMPRLAEAYPAAVGLVEAAARAGERGEPVMTWLGRTSPVPGEAFLDQLRAATDEGADAADVRAARRRARDWGRFTRNFVVQGTAAEWALCWMASLRLRLRALEGPAGRPHLVFFLHDEVLVHTPAALAEGVAAAVTEAAAEAGRLLFGATAVEFPLDVAVVDSYDQAG